MYHFDFYRIKRVEEAYDIGCEDYFDSGHPCFIEWPDIVEPLLPDNTLHVTLQEEPDGSRTLSW